ncbi:hypothetical protein BaRGS_00004930 [Batillaria attramentaria]|uniref:Pre-mRNA polyadenylation factor Fip1 domain-containing protein n=2 Tax=Batillaria attramentaria TaxID=370345 RepID=A0ABD0LWB5_9CAEN
MAATEAAAPAASTMPTVQADDDDAWLYGDDTKEGKEENGVKPKTEVQDEDKSKPEESNAKKDDREEGEMLRASSSPHLSSGLGSPHPWQYCSGSGSKPSLATKGIDIEAQGTINGVPVYEFDLDSIQNEEKPWRKPGADITDYFNYGFTEETWQQYCEKQRRLIAMNEGTSSVPKIISHYGSGHSIGRPDKDLSAVSRKNVVPIVNKTVGQINVIGGTAIDSRRPESEGDPIPVAGSHSTTSRKYLPPPGLPPTNLPPPHMPPMDYSIPPPGMPPPPGVPPPGMTVPPPGFPPVPDPFDPFYAVPPPDRTVPPPGFDDRSGFGFNPAHAPYSSTFTESPRPGASQQWETSSTFSDRDSRDRDWERDRERRESSRRERSPHRPDDDYSRSDSRKHRDDSDTESTRSSSKHKSRRRRRDKDDDASESLAGEETPKAD